VGWGADLKTHPMGPQRSSLLINIIYFNLV
jgi:hypothetical protein